MEGIPQDSEMNSHESEAKFHTNNEGMPENPGRRNFLKGMISAATLAVVGGQPLTELLREEVLPEQLEKELDACRSSLKEEYGVELDYNEVSNLQGTSTPLSLAERRDFAKSILDAMHVYPKEYVEHTKLRTVQGVKWYDDGKHTENVTRGYFRSSEPDRIVINKESPLSYFFSEKFGWGNTAVNQGVFHHEYYHLTDEHIHDNEFNKQWMEESAAKGADFRELSMKDFFSIRKEGFATSYGASKPSEDRAEIAMVLLTDPSRIMEQVKNEPALMEKVEEIKKEYEDRSGGIMDETYWNLLAQGDMLALKDYISLRERLSGK